MVVVSEELRPNVFLIDANDPVVADSRRFICQSLDVIITMPKEITQAG